MNQLASLLLAGSAAVLLAFGLIHLLYTFRGSKLQPRDNELLQRMSVVPLVISRETTMWKAWVGFNASHSFGAILFGLIYGQLALVQPRVLLSSPFLLAVGLALLCGYTFLGKRYWFKTPFRGIFIALALYVGGLIAAVV